MPGLGPRGYTQSIMTLGEAEQARSRFEAFLRAPGPVVIGDVQGSPCRKPAYEFLINIARTLEQRGLTHLAPLTHLTSGPPGVARGFEVVGHAAVAEITPGKIRLADGRSLPFAYSMLLPSFLGVDVLRACETITDAAGFVRVNAFNQSEVYPEVFAAGAAVAGAPCERSGCLAEKMGRRVARNIVARILGLSMVTEDLVAAEAESPIAVDDGWLVPEGDAAWARRAFERYFPVERLEAISR